MAQLIQNLTGKSFVIPNNPKNNVNETHTLLNKCVTYAEENGVKIVNISGGNLYEKNIKLILGFIWQLILKFSVNRAIESEESVPSTEKPVDVLLAWCNRNLEKYEIQVTDFTSSWKGGKALCCLIASLRPFFN